MKRICVFAGSNSGSHIEYLAAARALGHALVRHEVGLVYGGARLGLMGAVADTVLAARGHVTGVIPEALVAKEVAHTGLSELRVVASMHERKAMMGDLADGFIALPGGLGTLEEVFEVLTWAQLGLHTKAVRFAERVRLFRWLTSIPRARDRRTLRQTRAPGDGYRLELSRFTSRTVRPICATSCPEVDRCGHGVNWLD